MSESTDLSKFKASGFDFIESFPSISIKGMGPFEFVDDIYS